MTNFAPPNSALFFSKNDPLDLRLGELVKAYDYEINTVILGYPDDEGVKINGGRLGASAGPDAIRTALYKTTPHPHLPLLPFADLGNLSLNIPLSERHEAARKAVLDNLMLGKRALALGGGNDYAYSDGMAFLEKFKDQRPLVINVDAHFDVRSTLTGLSSGTPFYRMLESDYNFDFVELGIQSLCNSKQHWDYVQDKNGLIITQEEILESSLSLHQYCIEAMGERLLKRRPLFLAVDIDAFAWPYAMGSSAAWPLGLEPHAFWPLYTTLLARLDVQVLGIYEVAPGLETGPGTTKWAAQLAHRFLHQEFKHVQ